MNVDLIIYEALLERLRAVSFAPHKVDIAWPGTDYKPKAGGSYLRPSVLPNTTRSPFLSLDAENQYLGLFQVLICDVSGSGGIKAREIAGQITQAFARGSVITRDNVSIHVSAPPTVGNDMQEPDRLIVPVTIPYFSFA